MPGLLRQETGYRRGIAGMLFMPEGNDAHARGLSKSAEIGYRNAGNRIDVADAIELERIDDKMEAVRELRLGFGVFGAGGLCLC